MKLSDMISSAMVYLIGELPFEFLGKFLKTKRDTLKIDVRMLTLTHML